MWFEINNEKPIYRQLIEYFKEQILNNKLEADHVLPSVRAISIDIKVNPQTILKAFQELMNGGIIYKKRGIGMYVSKNARHLLIEQIKDSYLKEELPQCLAKGISLDIGENYLLDIINAILEEKDG